MAYSERLAQVLGEPDGVLARVSGNKAALRVARTGGELSNTTILDIKKGTYGRIESVRTLAHAYSQEILERHRQEIEEAYGASPQRSEEEWRHLAEDWLCAVADGSAYRTPRVAMSAGTAESGLSEADASMLARKIALEWAEIDGSITLKTEFAEAFREVFRDKDLDALSQALSVPRRELEMSLAGRPPAAATLYDWIGILDVSPVDANLLMTAAGYGHWSAWRGVNTAIARASREFGRALVIVVLPKLGDDDVELMTPGEVRKFERKLLSDLRATVEQFRDQDAYERLAWFYAELAELINEAYPESRPTALAIKAFHKIPEPAEAIEMSFQGLEQAIDAVRGDLEATLRTIYVNRSRPIKVSKARHRNEALREVLAQIAGSRTEEEISRSGRLDPKVVARVMSGESAGRKVLDAVLTALGASAYERRKVYRAGYFIVWDPHWAYEERLEKMLAELGFSGFPWVLVDWGHEITAESTPGDVDRMVQQAREFILDYREHLDEYQSGQEFTSKQFALPIGEFRREMDALRREIAQLKNSPVSGGPGNK